MVIQCYFCQGKVKQEIIDVDFRWGTTLKVIRDVPAEVCQQCGERYFSAGTYKAMEQLGASPHRATEHIEVDVLPFKAAS